MTVSFHPRVTAVEPEIALMTLLPQAPVQQHRYPVIETRMWCTRAQDEGNKHGWDNEVPDQPREGFGSREDLGLWNVELGVKLPTGDYNGTNLRRRVRRALVMVTRVTETGVGIVDGTNHPNHITNILCKNI